MRKQKGSSLATVLMVASLFLVIGLAVATATTHHLRISASKGEAERALALAEAGVQQVLYTVQDLGEQRPVNLLDPANYIYPPDSYASPSTYDTWWDKIQIWWDNTRGMSPIAPAYAAQQGQQQGDSPPDPLVNAFDGTGPDLPGYHGAGEVKITFNPKNPYYSTNNYYSSYPALGWGDRAVPPYSVHVISVARLGSTEKKIEAIISKRWPYVLFAGNKVGSIQEYNAGWRWWKNGDGEGGDQQGGKKRAAMALWGSTLNKGPAFTSFLTIGDEADIKVTEDFPEPYTDINTVKVTGNVFSTQKGKKPDDEVVKVYHPEQNQFDYSKLKKGDPTQPFLAQVKSLPGAVDLETVPGVEKIEYKELKHDLNQDGNPVEVLVGTGQYYYYIKENVTLKGNYIAHGDVTSYRLSEGSTDLKFGIIVEMAPPGTEIKIEDGGVQCEKTMDLRQAKVALDNGIFYSQQDMKLDGGLLVGGSTIEGQGIVASDKDLYVSSINVIPKEGETLVLFADGKFVISPSFTWTKDGDGKLQRAYAKGDFPSTINGIVLANKNLMVHPRSRLTLNGILVNFSTENSVMANVDVTYQAAYTKALNTYGSVDVVFWRELP